MTLGFELFINLAADSPLSKLILYQILVGIGRAELLRPSYRSTILSSTSRYCNGNGYFRLRANIVKCHLHRGRRCYFSEQARSPRD